MSECWADILVRSVKPFVATSLSALLIIPDQPRHSMPHHSMPHTQCHTIQCHSTQCYTQCHTTRCHTTQCHTAPLTHCLVRAVLSTHSLFSCIPWRRDSIVLAVAASSVAAMVSVAASFASLGVPSRGAPMCFPDLYLPATAQAITACVAMSDCVYTCVSVSHSLIVSLSHKGGQHE